MHRPAVRRRLDPAHSEEPPPRFIRRLVSPQVQRRLDELGLSWPRYERLVPAALANDTPALSEVLRQTLRVVSRPDEQPTASHMARCGEMWGETPQGGESTSGLGAAAKAGRQAERADVAVGVARAHHQGATGGSRGGRGTAPRAAP